MNYQRDTPVMALVRRANDHRYTIVNGSGDEGRASLERTEALLQWVLERKPDLDAINEDRDTALSLAINERNAPIVKLLLSHGVGLRPRRVHRRYLMHAAWMLDEEILHLLLAAGLSVPQDGAGALIAAGLGWDGEGDGLRVSIAKRLVELGADVNERAAVRMESDNGWLQKGGTPLMAAALSDDVELVRHLLSLGADVHAQDVNGHTALHLCSGQTWTGGDGSVCWMAREENLEVIQTLLAAGIRIDQPNARGLTAADLAREDNPDALALLQA